MATPTEVHDYLAHWCQLGKGIVMANGESMKPQPVLQGNRYSDLFEACWQKLLACDGRDCYLEGTNQTVADLLSNQWDVITCARCDMPIPSRFDFIASPCCPCQDLPNWPNQDLPSPRRPVALGTQLRRLHDRIDAASRRYGDN
ncbi:MAG: hypothetical protein AAGF24_08995 [Cyanobacteria bacterium P01_H01_bin.121]